MLKAQKLTGGNLNVFSQIEDDLNKRRIDYSNLGFGPPKPKKRKEDFPERRRAGESDISQAVHYKKETKPPARQMKLEHKVVIMEQPHVENMKEDMNKACNSYTCYTCGFTCSRLGVIIWHNKGHLKTVMNYDTGIRIPGRKKRRPKMSSKAKARLNDIKKLAAENIKVDHTRMNGHADNASQTAAAGDKSAEAKQLLMDWEDEDDETPDADTSQEYTDDAVDGDGKQTELQQIAATNNGDHNSDGEEDNNLEIDSEATAYRQRLEQSITRRPMRGVEALNSAFDALLADSATSNSSNNLPSSSNYKADESLFTNNDSDSDASDWEKYYAKDSENNDSEGEPQNNELEDEDEAKESDIKSLCEGSAGDEEAVTSSTVPNGDLNGAVSEREEEDEVSNDTSVECDSNGAVDAVRDPGDQADESNCTSPSGGDNSSSQATTGRSVSSSPSSSSGPAFMLVAVDAHGNNVPMPALTDRHDSNNLVAVEASMEDGTSRTLYIDPAYLEPNVDLSNLMLHIDNSGQETVIIPSSSSGGDASMAPDTPPQPTRPLNAADHGTGSSKNAEG